VPGNLQPVTASQLVLSGAVRLFSIRWRRTLASGSGGSFAGLVAFRRGAFSCSTLDRRGDVSSGICGGNREDCAPATSAGSRPVVLRAICVFSFLRSRQSRGP
jgi:hypothetical protein